MDPSKILGQLTDELKKAQQRAVEASAISDTKWFNYVTPNTIEDGDHYQTILTGLFFRASRKDETLTDYRYAARDMDIEKFEKGILDIGFKKKYSYHGNYDIYTSEDGVIKISHTPYDDKKAKFDISAASVNDEEIRKIDRFYAKYKHEQMETGTA